MATQAKPPKAPDPATIIALQNQYNRSNQVNPFGSSTWSSDGPGGHETQTTSASPQMQGAIDRAFALSATPSTPGYIPQGMSQLASGILGKVGSHYGMGGQGQPALDTNLKNHAGAPPAIQPGMLNGMPQMGAPQTMGMDPMAALRMQPGANGGQMGQLGGMMGGGSMGYSGGQNPLAALQAMQGQPMPQVQAPQGGGMQQPFTMGG